MRRWGLVVAIAYGLVVAVLVLPAFIALFHRPLSDATPVLVRYFQSLAPSIVAIAAAACQALLLFLSVDTSFRRLRPRRHLTVTIALTSLLATVLLAAGLASFVAAIHGDSGLAAFFGGSIGEGNLKNVVDAIGIPIAPFLWPALWMVWAVLFYFHVHNAPQPVAKAVGWLLKGSVMELLIAVPAHVIVRQRENCCAPVATSYGIVTGLAIALFAFGPGVLALYKRRLDAHARPAPKES
jgi:hypothetical protein